MDGRDGRLPVAVSVPPPMEAEVTVYVERELGWRRVALDGPPRPRLVVTDGSVAPHVPTVVLHAGVVDAERAGEAMARGAVTVLAWPAERERLARCADPAPGLPVAGGPNVLRVGGARGGIGVSTVTLAIGGLLAWRGAATAVVGDMGLLRLAGIEWWPGPGADELALLRADDAAREFPTVARAARAVPRLWLLRATAACPPAAGWPVGIAVMDAGVRSDVDMLLTSALPWSARVARAGRHGRVPAGLPGTYLQTLADAIGLRP